VIALVLVALPFGARASTTLFNSSGTYCTATAPCSQAAEFGILTGLNAAFRSSNDTLNGRIGLATGSTFSPSSGTIAGPVDFADPLTKTSDGYLVPAGSSISNTTITGGTEYNPTLISTASTQWMNISDYWKIQSGTALPTKFGRGTDTLTVSGGGAHVYTVNYNVNTNQAVTIHGGTSDLVIINVPAAYSFSIGAAVTLSGGITADQVLINVLGTSNYVLNINAGSSDPIDADFIVRSGNYKVNSGIVNGRVFGGIGSLQWYGSENAPPDPYATPESSTGVLSAIGTASVILGAACHRRTCASPPARDR
jgi:hypothetical protein